MVHIRNCINDLIVTIVVLYRNLTLSSRFWSEVVMPAIGSAPLPVAPRSTPLFRSRVLVEIVTQLLSTNAALREVHTPLDELLQQFEPVANSHTVNHEPAELMKNLKKNSMRIK